MRDEGDVAEEGGFPEERPPKSGGVTPKQAGIAVLGLVLVIFALLNFDRVEVNFILFSTRARVVTVIVVSALLGFGVGWFVGRPSRAERKRLRDKD